MGSSPSNAITIEEMRRRVRVMDAIDAALEASADKLVLEEADHQMLKQAVSTFPFSVAHKDLLAILDDVVNAADALTKPA